MRGSSTVNASSDLPHSHVADALHQGYKVQMLLSPSFTQTSRQKQNHKSSTDFNRSAIDENDSLPPAPAHLRSYENHLVHLNFSPSCMQQCCKLLQYSAFFRYSNLKIFHAFIKSVLFDILRLFTQIRWKNRRHHNSAPYICTAGHTSSPTCCIRVEYKNLIIRRRLRGSKIFNKWLYARIPQRPAGPLPTNTEERRRCQNVKDKRVNQIGKSGPMPYSKARITKTLRPCLR